MSDDTEMLVPTEEEDETNFTLRGDHTPECFQTSKASCTGGVSHEWSGWPGAYCLTCGADDMDELCIGRSCRCACHDEFWSRYSAEMEGSNRRT